MAEATHSSDQGSTGQATGTLSELREMFGLRSQLAQAEIRSDPAATRRLAIVGGFGLIAVLIGLPLLVSVVTARIDEALQLGFPWVSVTVAVALLGIGLLVGWAAWRRFRFEFLGLRDSLQEIQEDLIWLRDRFGAEE
jgi:uncharacterized membrane protein YqjE